MAGLDKDQFDNRDFRKYDWKGNKQMWIIYFIIFRLWLSLFVNT